MTPGNVSVVIPAINEEAAIGDAVHSARVAGAGEPGVGGLPYQYFLLWDGFANAPSFAVVPGPGRTVEALTSLRWWPGGSFPHFASIVAG